jgi:exodeoxyribonuclease III
MALPKKLKFICWNVNGIRAWSKKGCMEWVLAQKPDFFCIQETKAHPDQLTADLLNPPGYMSYFEHSKLKKGYSGVAVYTKVKPEKVEFDLFLKGEKAPDHEGRFVALHYKEFVLINCYFPNGGGAPERLEYKLKFYDAFLEYVLKLEKQGLNVIFCGDVNVAHTEIDIARPKENANHVGFLPVERAWVDKVISKDFTDTFRYLNPDARNAYSWWDMKSAARDRNIGWRIDYFFVDKKLISKVKKAEIHSDIYGSDHCPISIEMSL